VEEGGEMIPWELGLFIGVMSALAGIVIGGSVVRIDEKRHWERQCVVRGVAMYVADDEGNSVWQWKVEAER
jgi:hypothetical protein